MVRNKEMELHMSQFNIGDVVRIGKGKVEYVVSKIVNEPNELGTYAVEVESMNTGKAQVIEASRLTLLRAAESVEEANVEGEPFDPRQDRRQSAYGLAILAAVLRKNPASVRIGANAQKTIGSKRPKVRAKLKAQRTRFHAANARYNTAVREQGAYRLSA